MAYNSGVEYLLDKLGERKADTIRAIRGGTLTHEDYKRLCGVCDGLEFAENLIIELEKRLLADNEEEPSNE